ncbi:MAG: hypothetical protein K6F80_06605 [Oscillospiraceae bacterium]|nr:hypothetical protein [Oscillospiraceae bacterium]
MLKGVNHKVIEVRQPDSLYFERAVFYLRPEVDDLPPSALSETEHFLHTRRPYRFRTGGLFWFALGAVSAGGICFFLTR